LLTFTLALSAQKTSVLILKGIEILSLEMFHNDGKENPNGTYNNSKKNAALIDAYLDHAYLCVRV